MDRAGAGRPSLPATVHFRVGRAFLAGRRLDAALEHLQRAAKLDPSRSEISYALGQALLMLDGQPRRSRTCAAR